MVANSTRSGPFRLGIWPRKIDLVSGDPHAAVEPGQLPRSNPFATRFVAPGRVPWLADGDPALSLERLLQRLANLNFRAEVVGPHGSGKSTLLQHLAKELGGICNRLAPSGQAVAESRHGRLVWVQLRGRRSARQTLRMTQAYWRPSRILVVDGFEQLGWLDRCWLLHASRSRLQGLLVARHRRGVLPTLCRTAVSATMASQIVQRLVQADSVQRPWLMQLADRKQLEDRLRRQSGNLREVLMELFDEVQLVETRTATQASVSCTSIASCTTERSRSQWSQAPRPTPGIH